MSRGEPWKAEMLLARSRQDDAARVFTLCSTPGTCWTRTGSAVPAQRAQREPVQRPTFPRLPALARDPLRHERLDETDGLDEAHPTRYQAPAEAAEINAHSRMGGILLHPLRKVE
jgi:hypothetical protein